ncbi:MAG TPA: CoA transferase [Methylomirabilota bacterium]|nr:CoA transferase [Methylomirabilota bacterium]
MNDPHLVERGMWVDVKHAKRGKTRVPISPIRQHGGPSATVDRPAPLPGQDTDRVLSELLGLTPDELAALHAAGVIEPVKS